MRIAFEVGGGGGGCQGSVSLQRLRVEGLLIDCSTTLTRPPPIDVMVKRRAVGQGTDRTVSRRAALSEWRRWVTVLSSQILA